MGWQSSGFLRHVVSCKLTDVSEVLIASAISAVRALSATEVSTGSHHSTHVFLKYHDLSVPCRKSASVLYNIS
jgi:hypothetical protein